MTVLAERYELQELLGSGGMARVHAAVDRRLGRRVAVKLVRENLVGDGRSRQRLAREARSAASFHHPNSVAVFDVGEHERQPYIVMELVEGESLAERLDREGRLSAAETVRVGVGVLAALEAAHERGLVHRDIKPANVLLPQRGGVKLADFGIAKAVADMAGGITAVGDVMGTPKYLSPEQAAGQPAVPASDLYALGVVLYECLAGKPPFTGETPLAVVLAHQRQAVPPLRRAAPDVPAELARLVEQALAKDPGARFADAATMRRALEGQAGAAGAATAPGGAPAYAETAILAPATEPLGDRYASTTVLPEGDEPPGAAAPEESRPRKRRRVWLVLLALALAYAAWWAVTLLGPDPGLEEPPGGEPADQPVEEEPAPEEPAPEVEPAPEEPAPEVEPTPEEDPTPDDPTPEDDPTGEPGEQSPPGDS